MDEAEGKRARAPADLAALAREYLDLWEAEGAFHAPPPKAPAPRPDDDEP